MADNRILGGSSDWMDTFNRGNTPQNGQTLGLSLLNINASEKDLNVEEIRILLHQLMAKEKMRKENEAMKTLTDNEARNASKFGGNSNKKQQAMSMQSLLGMREPQERRKRRMREPIGNPLAVIKSLLGIGG